MLRRTYFLIIFTFSLGLAGCSSETPRNFVCSGGASFSFYKSKAFWGEHLFQLVSQKGNVRFYRRSNDSEDGLRFDEVSERIYLTVYKNNELLPGSYWIEDCKKVT
jgi:hypothetical protein